MNQSHGSVRPSSQRVEESNWSFSALTLAFIVSFSLAAGIFLIIGHYGFKVPRSLVPFAPDQRGGHGASGDLAFQPFTVSRGGVYIKSLVGETADPAYNEDYTLFVWFKLRHLPDVGESVGLVGKFDSQAVGRPGYALSLEGAPDGVRPRVYISTEEVGERWYTFSSYPMNRRDWYLLAMSIEQRAFVSTLIGRAFSPEPLVLLGGHRLSGKQLPGSAADLVVGAFGASRFRGQIGPFGVMSGANLAKHVGSYLQVLQEAPGIVPSKIPTDVIRVWASPTEDRGPKKVTLVTSNGQSARIPVVGGGGAVVGKSLKHPPKKVLKKLAPPKKVSKKIGNKKK